MSFRWATRQICGYQEWKCFDCGKWVDGGALRNGDVYCFDCLGNREASGFIGKDSNRRRMIEDKNKKDEPEKVQFMDLSPMDMLIIEGALRKITTQDSVFMFIGSQKSIVAKMPEVYSVRDKFMSVCASLRKEGLFSEYERTST